MPAAFEILETPMANSPLGTFVPKADQTKFRSAFACVAGPQKGGFPDQHYLEQGLISSDGRTRLRFAEFKDEKGKVNTIFKDGMTLREFTVPKEDAEAFQNYAGAISAGKVDEFLKARGTGTENGTQIGRSSVGEQINEVISTTK